MRLSRQEYWKLEWLLAAALLLRAVIPAGFMPVSLTRGLLFDICPANIPAWVMTAGVHAGHHPHVGMKHDSQTGEAQRCPFGLMLASALTLTQLWHFVLTPLALPPFELAVYGLAGIHPVPYQSRGPPV